GRRVRRDCTPGARSSGRGLAPRRGVEGPHVRSVAGTAPVPRSADPAGPRGGGVGILPGGGSRGPQLDAAARAVELVGGMMKRLWVMGLVLAVAVPAVRAQQP